MKQIVLRTVKSAEDIVINRRNTFEHFGYDFMIDDNFTPWLIEINSSPAVDYSTVCLYYNQITFNFISISPKDL